MKVLQPGEYIDRLGGPYGKFVGAVDEDGNCAGADERGLPYLFEGTDATQQSSYHRYYVKEEMTKLNITLCIKNSSLTQAEKEDMYKRLDNYYKDNSAAYGDGLAYGQIAPMFSSAGGGYQYAMPLNMSDLIKIGMIEEVYDY